MDRRNFIKLGALTLSPVILKFLNDWTQPTATVNFDIEILSDAAVGHILRESQSYDLGENKTTECLVVGGGIAGLAAAYRLRQKDFLLCELSPKLGGSSSAHYYKDQYFAQGAHYELAYPAYYGQKLLQILFDLNIIGFDAAKQMWLFVDKYYLINSKKESITFDKGVFRADVLPEGQMKEKLRALLKPFVGHMPLPTSSIKEEFHYLNELSFYDFLQQKISPDKDLLQAIDYAMLDDWGATSKEVSALAGVHYYTCRPYFDGHVELFSPPEGNAYFAQKFISKLPQKRLLASHLVRKIEKTTAGFVVQVVDVKAKKQFEIKASKIVYAAHKHALKFIYPNGFAAFQNTKTAPWFTISIVIKDKKKQKVYWQNEYLTEPQSFMGFVDSAAQYQTVINQRRTLTAYYCLKTADRNNLLDIEKNASAIVEQTIEYIEEVLKVSIRSKIEKVFIKVMGHAMPIPAPNYLLQNPNHDALREGIAYAGVDTGRLPLFFEAADSGIEAVDKLYNSMDNLTTF